MIRPYFLLSLALIGGLLAVYFLRETVTLLVVSLLIAFVLDPMCDRLEAWGMPRTLAALLILFLFVLLSAGAIVLLIPVVLQQLIDLAAAAPGYSQRLLDRLIEFVGRFDHGAGVAFIEQARTYIGSGERIVDWLTKAAGNIVAGGIAVADWVLHAAIVLFIVFFVLRDFRVFLRDVDQLIPPAYENTLRELGEEAFRTLAGFLRGQGLVCLLLGTFYAIALTLVGLKYGLLIGLLAGLISFVPYAGATVGFILSVGGAAIQFESMIWAAGVAGIFWAGQMIEGNLLAPILVGDRVRLHPVWVIVALYAGGTIFGLVGILLAVPVAAVLGVLMRFAKRKYLESRFFRDHMPRR